MKAYAIIRTFGDGSKEGVIFTDKQDADSALNGTDSGSTLAVEFTDTYGGEPLQMVEIDIQGDQIMSDKKGFDGCTCQRVGANCQHCQDMSDKPELIFLNGVRLVYPATKHYHATDTERLNGDNTEYLRADLAKPSEWISVSDRLPDNQDIAFLCWNGKERAISYYSQTKGFDVDRMSWYVNQLGCGDNDCELMVTHWQPLPPPPDKD